MNKNWKKGQDNTFTFKVDDMEIGKMSFTFNTTNKAASFNIGTNTFSIKQQGIFNNRLFITDGNEKEIAKLYPEKWYASNWVLEYGDIFYKLSVRNNPLAEYVITLEQIEILAYGLQPNAGQVQVKITGSPEQNDFILDFLLWYLFVPVALENIGDNLTFTLLFT